MEVDGERRWAPHEAIATFASAAALEEVAERRVEPA